MEFNLKPETKTALGSLGITLLSMLCLYLIAFNDQITNPVVVAVAVAAVVVAAVVVAAAVVAAAVVVAVVVVAAGAVVAAAVVAAAGAGAAVGAGATATAGAAVVAVGVTWDKNEKKVSIVPALVLCLVFALPLIIGIVPLSKYHNQNQIERDKRIAEIVQIKVLEDRLEVLLPSEHASENSYLKNVLFIGWDLNRNGKKEKLRQSWKETAISCREGERKWHKAHLAFPEEKNPADKLVLFFNHAWEDFQTIKTVSLNSP